MSINQSRAEKSEYRKLGRSGSSGQPRNFTGGGGKGGGGGGGGPTPPPSSSSLSSNRSFKKPNYAQGGQSRVSGVSVNSDSYNTSAARAVQNGAPLQPPLQEASDAPATGITIKPTDGSTQKSTRAVPKAPSSHPATVSSDTTAPLTPAKDPGDVPRSFPLQFGSISPGFMNGMQVPARTSSAPPNLDEQKRDQARHDSFRAVPTLPIPSTSKQQVPKKNVGAVDQSHSGEAHPMPHAKRDVQVSSVPQPQKPSVHPFSGSSMQMPFHQPMQFGGPNQQMHSQGITATSMPLPMQMMPLPIGNHQVPQQVFVPSLQSHTMQPQGIVHQGQSMGFSSQMGPQLPPHMGNLGVSTTPQFPQQQAGNFGVPRKTVKITHPDTHEELRLDKRTDSYNVPPQSQPIPSFPPGHPINFYPNSYNAGSHFFPPSSLPLTSTQINPSSQAPRFSYPVSQGPHTGPFVNPSALNTFSVNKGVLPSHGIADPSNLEHAREVQKVVPSAPVQVTVKPASGSYGEKVAHESSKLPRPHVEAGLNTQERDSEISSRSSLQPSKLGPEPTTTLLPLSSEQSVGTSPFISSESLAPSASSSVSTLVEESASVVVSSHEGGRGETISRSNSVKDQQKNPGKNGHSQSQDQVGEQSIPFSSIPYQSSELSINSVDNRYPEAVDPKTSLSSEICEGVLETTAFANSDTSDSKTDSAGESLLHESLQMNDGAPILIDNHIIDRLDDFSLRGDQQKPETVGTKELVEILLPKADKQGESSFDTSLKSMHSESSEAGNQTDQKSVRMLITTGSSVAAQRELEEPGGYSTVDAIDAEKDAIDAEKSPTGLGLSIADFDDKTSSSDASLSKSDNMGSKAVDLTTSMLDHNANPVSTPCPSEVSLKCEDEGIEDISAGLVSILTSTSKDRILESNKGKSNVAKGKKKRKEILQKADAAGTTSDLYMAYKGPEENKETVFASSESIESTASNNLQPISIDTSVDVSSEKVEQSKAEPDDWEDAADVSTPELETSETVKPLHEDVSEVMAKKYSRDFLLKFAEQCTDLPEVFVVTSDIEALMTSSVTVSRESLPSPGRIVDRPTGGSRPDRRVRGMGDEDKWSKFSGPVSSVHDMRLDINYGANLVGFRPGQVVNHGVLRNPGPQTPVQYPGGILSGPMHRNNADSERWQRATGFHKGLIPSPQTPLQVMHKAENKYEVGRVTDEEQAKQRQLKAILNKLTPQNFERLFEQVKAVNIDNAVTLTGVISQIFDKALTEPTFCEMYANFCFHLAGELPDFSADNEKITFKRLLLNKCQEEFERGEREQEEANRAEEEGEVKQSEQEREERRTQARRRMLGNIRLIGELYKKKMLTERIMHECIKKLLGQSQSPDEEDIEALCKLMSTIGEMIDHPRAKEHMDAYFDRMAKLSNNMNLSSRVRFMLKDAIDLRKNRWQQRRKVEGPKKIEEVHRDAAQERQAQASRLARGPGIISSVRRGQPMDFSQRSPNMFSSPNTQMGNFRGPPTQLRGYGIQDARLEERHFFENRNFSVPLTHRPIGDESITLGPQGGLARGMSFRGQPSVPNIPLADVPSAGDSRRMTTGLNGYSSVSERPAYGPREDLTSRLIPERLVSAAYDQSSMLEQSINYGNRDPRNADRSADRSLPISPPTRGRGPILTQNDSSEKLTEEHLRDMSLAAIKEFYSAKDEKEVALCIKDLNAPSFYPSMVSIWVTDSFERKDMERDLLAKLLINLTKSQDIILREDQLIEGFEAVLATLEDAVNDAPKAAEFLGRILAKVIVDDLIPFSEIAQLVYKGGEEKGRLVEIGLAAEVVGSVLELIKSEKGDSAVNEIRTTSTLQLEDFRPPNRTKSLRLDKFI